MPSSGLAHSVLFSLKRPLSKLSGFKTHFFNFTVVELMMEVCLQGTMGIPPKQLLQHSPWQLLRQLPAPAVLLCRKKVFRSSPDIISEDESKRHQAS